MTDDELKGLFDRLQRHFDVVTESTRGEIRIVSESVSALDEKLGRMTAVLEEKIERTAA